MDSVWLHRLRVQFGITAQTVNAKYKVAFGMAVRRLGVAWRNVTRLLALFHVLFLGRVSRFETIDE